jgi:streptogramin lyase
MLLKSQAKPSYNSALKLSALSVMVAALSGCGEDAKDCNGFWDKTFGREECGVQEKNQTPPNKSTQSIPSLNFPALKIGEKTTLTANASSGLIIGYATKTPNICTVSGAEVTAIAQGECTIEATQVGNAMYLAATPVLVNQLVTPVCTTPQVLSTDKKSCILPSVIIQKAKPQVFAVGQKDQENVVKFVRADNTTVTSNPKTSTLMQINTPTNVLKDTPVGTILVFGQDNNFPHGFAGRITEKQQMNTGALQVGFELVQLDEVFSDVKINLKDTLISDPVFYPAEGLQSGEVIVPTAKSRAMSKAAATQTEKTIINSFDTSTKTLVAGINIAGGIVRNLKTKEFNFVKKCEDVKDVNLVCLSASVPLSIKLANMSYQDTTGIELKSGKLSDGDFNLGAEVSASAEIKLDTQDASVKGKKFSISGANLIKGLIGTNSKLVTGEYVFEKDVGLGTGRITIKGVPWPETRQAIGSFVFRARNLAAGVIIPTWDGGSRDVGIDPQMLITIFIDSNLELHGEIGAKVTTAVYKGNAGFRLRNQKFESTNSFAKVDDAGFELSAKGGAEATLGLGVAAGIGLFNIVPFDFTMEVGTKAAIDAQVDYQDGKFSGCHTNLAWTWGYRVFFDAAVSIEADYVSNNGSVTEWYNNGLALHLGILNDNQNWNTIHPVMPSIGEDTCHQPKIIVANWKGGDFITQQYMFEFDATATRHKPLVKYMVWDYGDGTTERCAEAELDACYVRQHTYNSLGKKEIKLSVVYTDESSEIFSIKNGQVNFQPNLPEDPVHTDTWTVDIKKPAAAIDNYPASGLTGVIGICTTCIEGLTSYDVDWGDGKVESFTMGNQDTQHKHAYASEGSKLVVLTLKDKFNNTFQEARTINVSKSVMAINGGTKQILDKPVEFSLTKFFSDAASVLWQFFTSLGEDVISFAKDLTDKATWTFDNVGDYKAVAKIRSSEGVVETVEQNFIVRGEKASIEKNFNNPNFEREYDVQNIGLDTSDGTLRLPLNVGEVDTTFPYIWIANSGAGTISKLATRDHYRKNPQTGEQELVKTGQELGRYRTGPGNGNPSRTTVDQEGNVWVGNRNNNTITKVGLFEFGNCIDRNGNGKIDTSTGKDDIKDWSGYFGDGQGIANAQDECMLQHVALQRNDVETPTDIRMIAIDKDNNIFAAGDQRRSVFKVNGRTGEIIAATNTNGSFYGGLVDKEGNLWAVSRSYQTGVQKINNDLTQSKIYQVGLSAYGLALDKYNKLWVTEVSSAFSVFDVKDPENTLRVFNQTGNNSAQGVATDDNGDVFIAGSLYRSVVGHYKQVFNNGVFTGVEFVANYPVGSGPTGVAVDGKGNVWATNYYSSSVSQITLAANPVDAIIKTFDVGANPYNYSDMTGRTVRNITNRQGTWEAVFDGGTKDFEWKKLVWTLEKQLPEGTTVTASVKAANNKVELSKDYNPVESNQTMKDKNGELIKGQFIKVKFTLTSANQTSTPEITGIDLQ